MELKNYMVIQILGSHIHALFFFIFAPTEQQEFCPIKVGNFTSRTGDHLKLCQGMRALEFQALLYTWQ